MRGIGCETHEHGAVLGHRSIGNIAAEDLKIVAFLVLERGAGDVRFGELDVLPT